MVVVIQCANSIPEAAGNGPEAGEQMNPIDSNNNPIARFVRQFERNPVIVLTLCATIPALYILFTTISFDIHQHGDSTGYMILALSMCEGNGFQLIARPEPIHFLWWPPGFPAFLAVFARLFGPRWTAAKILIFLLTYAAVIAFGWLIYRKSRSLTASAFIVTVLSVNPFLHQQLSYLYSEAFYICVSVAFFLLWYRWKTTLTVTKVVILSLIAVYVASIRNIGLALPVAFTIYLLGAGILKRSPAAVLRALIPFFATMGLVLVFTIIPASRVGSFMVFFDGVPGYATPVESTETGILTGFLAQLTEYGEFVLQSARSYALTLIPKLFMVSTYHAYVMNPWKAFWGVLISGMVLVGFFRTIRRDSLQNLYVAVYGSVLLIYPALYSRLLVPILPFLTTYLYFGIVATARLPRLPGRVGVVLFIPLWFLIAGDNLFWISTTPYRYMPSEVGDRNHQECLDWVIRNARDGEVIVSQVDRYLFIRRGRYTVPIPDARTPVEMISALEAVNADIVFVAPYLIPKKVHETLRQTIRTTPNRFQMLYGNPNNSTQVYKFYSEWERPSE